MTPDERLRNEIVQHLQKEGEWSVHEGDREFEYLTEALEYLAARGLAVVEVSKGEPSEAVTPPCSESVSRGDEPTREDGLRTAHPCSCAKHPTGCYGHPDTCGCRVAALEAALRDAIHQLTTRNGYTVSDRLPRPASFEPYQDVYREVLGGCDPDNHFAISRPGTYWRDDTTEAVKRLQAVLDGS